MFPTCNTRRCDFLEQAGRDPEKPQEPRWTDTDGQMLLGLSILTMFAFERGRRRLDVALSPTYDYIRDDEIPASTALIDDLFLP